MNVKQLIEELQQHPMDMDVFFFPSNDGFEYEMVNITYQQKINFKDGVNGITLAEDVVLVLDEKY